MVISIIVILASILLPALKRAQYTVLKIQCCNRQQNLFKASSMYRDDYNDYFPISSSAARWRIKLLPYINQNLANRWTEADGWKSLSALTSVFRCPVVRDEILSLSQYIAGIGINNKITGSEGSSEGIKVSSLRKPSSVILLGDTNDNSAQYFYPVHLYKSTDYRINLNGFRHNDGINIGYCDGHASWHLREFLVTNSSFYEPE